jgi:hypothetical protein
MAVSKAIKGRRTRTRPSAPGYRPLAAHQSRRCRSAYDRQHEGGSVPSAAEYFRPLRPLHVLDDENRYLDIDSAEELYSNFIQDFADPARWTDQGHVVVVTGDSGYGKTSLIQRCARWLRDYQQQECEVVVLDLSDEQWGIDENQADRIARVFGRMLHILRSDLTEQAMADIKGNSPDMIDSFKYLGDALRSRWDDSGVLQPPIVIVVLLPGYPKPSEIVKYHDLVQPGMFFFAEMFEPEHIGNMIERMKGFKRSEAKVSHLATSVLKSGDAELIAEWIRSERPGAPELPDEIVSHRLVPLITQWQVSMSEFTRTALGVLDCAAAESAPRVTDDHFFQYYQQREFGSKAARCLP